MQLLFSYVPEILVAAADMIQNIKVVFKGFPAAKRVADDDTRSAKACQGKGHGNTMVIVSFNTGSMGLAGFYENIIALYFRADAHAGKIVNDGSHAVTFLETDMSYITDACGTIGKWCHSGQCQRLIGETAHIDINAF